MQIFWMESADHCEDWFVAAESSVQAIQFFCDSMGYDQFVDHVSASLIPNQPCYLISEKPHFLENSEIRAAGGKFIEFHDQDILAHVPEESMQLVAGETRVVRFGQKAYMEGNVLRVALHLEGKLTRS